MRKAAVEADIALILKALGKEPVMLGDKLTHPDYKDFVIQSPTEWERLSGQTAQYGKYVQGNALHYMIEYEGYGFQAAVKRICEIAAPQVLPNRPIARMRPLDRIELIKKQNMVQDIIRNQQNEDGEDSEDGESSDEEEEDDDSDYPSSWPIPNDNPADWENAKKTAARLDGIDRLVMDYLLERRWAFVGSGPYHMYLVFPGPRPDGKPGFFYVRSLFGMRPRTMKPLAQFQRYDRWAWHAGPETTELQVFDQPLEAAACMTVCLHTSGSMDAVRDMNVIALSSLSDIPLLTYLKTHDVLHLRLRLSNTENGASLAKMITEHLKGAYEIETEPPDKQFETWRHQASHLINSSGA